MKHILNITPQSALRPSPTKSGRMVDKPEYKAYKNALILLLKGKTITYKGNKIKGSKVDKGDFTFLLARFYFPYPKSEPKYKRIEGKLHRRKPDWDNCAKALQDAIEQANIIKNDSKISGGDILKLYTTKPIGRIEFELKL